jgi:hypothetical protein
MKILKYSLALAALALIFLPHEVRTDSTLQVRVEVDRAGTNFSFTVFNDEPLESSHYLTIWHLVASAPFQVISTPPGWSCFTDNSTYVDWFSTDAEWPYVNDIAPGVSLGGFALASVVPTFEDLPFAAVSWDHAATNSGPSYLGTVASPSIMTVTAVLTNVLYSSASSTFQFTVAGIPTLKYSVETSLNLKDWIGVTTNASPFLFVDRQVNNPAERYFRAVYVDSISSSDADAP